MAQLFYARRILILTKNKWITLVIVVCSFISGCESCLYSRPKFHLVFCFIGCAIGTGIVNSFDTSIDGLHTALVRVGISLCLPQSTSHWFYIGIWNTLANCVRMLRYHNCGDSYDIFGKYHQIFGLI